MPRRTKQPPPRSGLYHAREARRMSRSELVRLSGVSKQQLSRLETGLIRLRLDHLKPFAGPLGYTPEQILLWGRYPGTTGGNTESSGSPGDGTANVEASGRVPELDTRAGLGGGLPAHELRKDGRYSDALKTEGWVFPASFVREQLHSSPSELLVLHTTGDSMEPTIASGERVIVDTAHKTPTPDGLYAIRDAFKSIVVKRLQALRSTRPPRVKIISDNANHPSEEAPLGELEIVGKVLCCLKLF
jgi:transcriptional regulator with XRE-family HTH domain